MRQKHETMATSVPRPLSLLVANLAESEGMTRSMFIRRVLEREAGRRILGGSQFSDGKEADRGASTPR